MDAVIEGIQAGLQKLKIGVDGFEVDLQKLRNRTFTDQGAPVGWITHALCYVSERFMTAIQCDFGGEEPLSEVTAAADDRSGVYTYIPSDVE